MLLLSFYLIFVSWISRSGMFRHVLECSMFRVLSTLSIGWQLYPVKPTWRLDTKLYKLSWNISSNNPIHCIDPILSRAYKGLQSAKQNFLTNPTFSILWFYKFSFAFYFFFRWLMAKYQIRKTQNDVTGQSLIVRIATETRQSTK